MPGLQLLLFLSYQGKRLGLLNYLTPRLGLSNLTLKSEHSMKNININFILFLPKL